MKSAIEKISWRRILVEASVIVGSILLAFGIDAWWDARMELAEEQRYLEGLDAEFTENIDILESVIARHEQFAGLFDRLQAMSDDEVLAIPADEVDSYDRALGQWMTFEPRGGTTRSRAWRARSSSSPGSTWASCAGSCGMDPGVHSDLPERLVKASAIQSGNGRSGDGLRAGAHSDIVAARPIGESA